MKYVLKLYCLLTLTLLLSCEKIEIQNNRRLDIKGNIEDEVGNPIPNTFIALTLLNSNSFNNIQNIAGEGYTDNNGKFQFTSVTPRSTDSNLIIDPNFGVGEESNESTYVKLGLSFSGRFFDDVLELNLNDLKLPKQSHLELNIQKTSSDPLILNWSLDFISDSCFLEITSIDELENLSFCNNFIRRNGQNNPENPDEIRSFKSLKNSIAIFSYSINNEPDQFIEIPLNEINNEFEFNY